MLLSDAVEWPVHNLQSIAVIISLEVSLYVLVDPNLFQHSVQLFFNINVVLKAQFYLLLAFQNLPILVLEKDSAKIVQFGHKSDKLLMLS